MSPINRWVEMLTPELGRTFLKRYYWKFVRSYNKHKYIKKGKCVEFGYRFRFSRIASYYARIGSKTIIEEFNVWNAKMGDICTGEQCWFGLHNIIMGPVEFGDRVSTGPYVCVLGPKHPVFNADQKKREKTIIGNNVWLGTGAIIFFGVTIGDNAIVSAGSVVMKDIPPNSFASGNPAKDLSKLPLFAGKGLM